MDYPPILHVPPIHTLRGQVVLPGSKSLSNRAMLLSALAKGNTTLHNVLNSEDTQVMLDALKRLGVGIVGKLETGKLQIEGCGGPLPASKATLHLGNAGTAMRPLTAALTLGQGIFYVQGVARMHERPIQDLVNALRQLGADIAYQGKAGYPPLCIKASGLQGGEASLSGRISSQYLSALLMVGALAKTALCLRIADTLVSRPYVDMSIRLLKCFGVEVETPDPFTFRLAGKEGGLCSPKELQVEGDASSASYFLAGAALTGGEITVYGCGKHSWQGDVRFADVLSRMGAEVTWGEDWVRVAGGKQPLLGVDVDMNTMPDAAMTLAVMGLFTQSPVRVGGVANWRVKETDRMAALSTELAKLGAGIKSGEDWLEVSPPKHLKAAQIAVYDDHRMAMAFSLAACSGVQIPIENPQCVQKTFPKYFEVLDSLRHPL